LADPPSHRRRSEVRAQMCPVVDSCRELYLLCVDRLLHAHSHYWV
jgi:hypothetical protein